MSLSFLFVKPVTINGRKEVIVRAVREYKIQNYLMRGWIPLEEHFEPEIDVII